MQRILFRGILFIAVSLSCTAALTACGQKGDLYHPEEKPSAAAADLAYT